MALLRFRYLFSFLLLALTASGIPFLKKALTPNNALSVWFLDDDPQLAEYERFHRQFGNDEVIILTVHDKHTLFRPGKLRQLQQLTRKLENTYGIHRVYSLTNAQDFGYRNGRLAPVALVPDILPVAADDWQALQYRATHSSLYTGRLVDSTGRTAMLILQMKLLPDMDYQRDAIVAQVRKAATDVLGSEQVHLGGIGVIYAGLNQLTQHDFGLFVSVSYLIMFGFLWVLYRKLALVLLPLGAVLTATLLTLEVYGALGYQVNMITMMLPTLIILLGLAGSMHLLNEYHQLHAQLSAGQRGWLHLTLEAMKRSFRPCLYSTLTTIAGFLAFAFSPMAVLRELGYFSALGIGLCMVCTFVFSAAVLPMTSGSGALSLGFSALPERLISLMQLLHQRQKFFWFLLAGVTVLFGIGAGRVVTDTYTIGYLPDQHPVVQDHRFIQSTWGDYVPLEFTVRPLGNRQVNDPKELQAMSSFCKEAQELQEVSSSLGLHTFYEALMPQVYGGAYHNQLKSKSAIRMVTRQVLRHNPLLLTQLADTGFRIARITLTGKMLSAARLDTVLHKVDLIAKKYFKGLATVTATGYPPLYARIVSYVMGSQKQSFVMAIGMVFGLMLLLMRNLKMALLAVIPNLFPVLLLMAVMGYTGIHLDIATVMVAAIVIGFSIDDTIHLSFHYRHYRQEGHSATDALQRAWQSCGSAVVLSSTIIFIGFLVLLLASVKSVYYFGLLTCLTIIGEMVAQLILFPLLLMAFDKKETKRVGAGPI